VAELDKNVT